LVGGDEQHDLRLLLLLRSRWVTPASPLTTSRSSAARRCLVQIVWFYYALPIVLQVELPLVSRAGLGLTTLHGALPPRSSAAGIISIDKGQWQASRH